MRNALLGLLLVGLFGLAGAGLYALLVRRGVTPVVPVTAAELAGRWKSERIHLKIEAEGANLRVFGLDDSGSSLFSSTGAAPRWTENSPESKVPKLLEWNGQELELRIFDDSGRMEAIKMRRSP